MDGNSAWTLARLLAAIALAVAMAGAMVLTDVGLSAAHDAVDQSQDAYGQSQETWDGYFVYPAELDGRAYFPAGQVFTPSASNLTGIDVILSASRGGVSTELTAFLFEGADNTGLPVATSTHIVQFAESKTPTLVHLDFGESIALEVGAPYTLGLQIGPFVGITYVWHYGRDNPYASGHVLTVVGGWHLDRDLAFRTYFEKPPTAGPTSKDDCKNSGWANYDGRFKNQGDCVSSVVTAGRNPGASD